MAVRIAAASIRENLNDSAKHSMSITYRGGLTI